jgi:hypothetical protein
MFSLRYGAAIFATLIFCNGLVEVVAEWGKWLIVALGLVEVVAGSLGLYAVYSNKGSTWSFAFFCGLMVCFACHLGHFLYTTRWDRPFSSGYAHEQCEGSQDYDACVEVLSKMTNWDYEASNWMVVTLTLLFYTWSGVIVYSYNAVLAAGGSGEEKLKAADLGTKGERKGLMKPSAGK